MRRAFLRLVACLFIVAAIVAALAVWGYARYDAPGPLAEDKTVIVERGAGIVGIAQLLETAGVVDSALLFRAGTRATGFDLRLKAGEYAIPAHASPREIASLLASGRTVVRRLTLAEGLTTAEILRHVAATDGLTESVKSHPDEGDLLPETYHFSYGDSREVLIRRMSEAMSETLAKQWAGRREGLPLSNPQEALILASIVEKETGLAAERPQVAAVFLNRLRKGMKLQSDPTVAYGVTRGAQTLDRALTRADLQLSSPYNTYLNSGLPPAPICNPGVASIAAVLQPATNDNLYFVADGSGGHVFARTLVEHNRNVRAWRRLQQRPAGAAVPEAEALPAAPEPESTPAVPEAAPPAAENGEEATAP